jgi:hypothetical protein
MTSAKASALLGILFAILLVGGLFSLGTPPSGDEATDEQVRAWFEDSGNQKQQLVAGYALTAAGLALLSFAVLALAPAVEAAGRTSALPRLITHAATVAGAGIAMGAFALAGVSVESYFSGDPVDPGVARFLPSVGYGSILVLGGLASALMIVCVSVSALRANSVLPAWFGWFGFVCAIALLFAVIFLPMFALPLWAIVASILLFMRTERPAGALHTSP